jgi:hypothetical protein
MALYVCNMPNITTTAGGTTTTTLKNFDDAYGLMITCPSGMASTGIAIHVEQTSTGTSFFILQSGGVDVQMVTGRATVICPVPFKQMRLVCTAAEAGATAFGVTKQVMT